MNSVILESIGVNKFFQEPVKFHALKDINIQIYEGQFVAIVGSSGSGKSTLLYILATLDTDYEGTLLFRNNKLTGLGADKLSAFRNKNMGFVFQFHYLLPEFTVLENLMLPALKLAEKSRSDIKSHAYELMNALGIEDQALKPANRLSGGQQQRVAIARALMNQPALIIADEPTGNLDSKNSQLALDLFKRLTREMGQTLLVVTHDGDFAQETDRIIRLHDGAVISDEIINT